MTREQAINYLRSSGFSEEQIQEIVQALEQEPRKGHWILDETDNSRTCSNCNCQLWTSDILRGDACYYPNCGAEMEGEGE